jgi:DNA-binding response OmpR family regulator
MTRLSYDTADTLVFDPVVANRTATRMALYNLGFRKIEAVGTLDAFVEAVKRRSPDLALCDAQGAGDELCGMIQDLRLGQTGYNPFIVIIVTSWEQNGALVTRVLNSGADDLLLRPFSTATLGQRLLSHIERRKGFVITSEYVGPDRRRESSRPSGVELFQPPNSLKMKARDGLTSEEATQRLDLELKSAREILNSEKLRRDAFQLCVLGRLMQVNASGSSAFEIDLSKLKDITKSVGRRCTGSAFEPAIEWCDNVLAALDGLEIGADRNASMHLLGHATLTLNQLFSPEKSRVEHLTAIDATVAIVRARLEAGAAAQKPAPALAAKSA